MIKKEKTIKNLFEIAEDHIGISIPFYLKEMKKKPKTESVFRFSGSSFYQSSFVICKSFYKVIHMPFSNLYRNGTEK